MSKNISDFFKIEPKGTIKSEKEQNFVINLDKSKIVKSKVDEGLLNSAEIRIIKEEVGENNSEFQNLSKQANQNGSEWPKTEPRKDLEEPLEEHHQNSSKITSKSSNRKIKVECKFCDFKVSKSNLPRHMMALHLDEIQNLLLNCKFCDHRFFNKANLTIHMKKTHPKESLKLEPVRFECDIDGKVFIKRSSLANHMKLHLPRIKCKICQTEVSHNYISEHLKQVHAIGRKFKCEICNLNYKTSADLKSHKGIHNKKYQCQVCNRMFQNQGFLNQHNKFHHENPNSFECEICGKKFNEKGDCKKHQKKHDKNHPRRFKCQRCVYATDRESLFNNHKKYHENQDIKFAGYKNPIKCEKCPNLYRDKRSLKKHLKIVHPEVPFQCDLCGNYYRAMYSIKGHIAAHMRQSNRLRKHS